MKEIENKHSSGSKHLNFANKIIKSITSGCLKGRNSEKLDETKHYNTGEQLKLFDIKEETKEEIQDRRDIETTIEIIEGLFNLCLKNNDLQDDMELNNNATISKIKHNKIVAQSISDNEKASYTHTQEFIGIENIQEGDKVFFYALADKNTTAGVYSHFAIALPNYAELRRSFFEYLKSDLKKCLNIVTYLNSTLDNKDEIVLLRKCIRLLKCKNKRIEKSHNNNV